MASGSRLTELMESVQKLGPAPMESQPAQPDGAAAPLSFSTDMTKRPAIQFVANRNDGYDGESRQNTVEGVYDLRTMLKLFGNPHAA